MSIIPKKKKWRFLLGAIILAIVAAFAANGSSAFDKNVQIVQNGHLESMPDQKIGPAFKEFFGDPKWKSFTSTDNKEVVDSPVNADGTESLQISRCSSSCWEAGSSRLVL